VIVNNKVDAMYHKKASYATIGIIIGIHYIFFVLDPILERTGEKGTGLLLK